jgi:DNA-binding NarL/FixJ family response regulator
MEVCNMLCEGASDKEIMERLGISFNTAKRHLQDIFRAFGVNDRLHTILRCFENGIVDGSHRKSLPDTLNASERRTAVGLLQAKSYREIAEMSNLVTGTIKHQAHSVFDKCGVWSRYELSAKYTE